MLLLFQNKSNLLELTYIFGTEKLTLEIFFRKGVKLKKK